MTSPTDEQPARLPIRRGAVSGVGAWFIGYVLFYALSVTAIRESTLARLVAAVTGASGDWRLVGWLFYSAHFSESTVPVLFGGETVNFVSTINGASTVLFAIPPILLFLAGVAVRAGTPRLSTGSAAKHGLTVVLGYLPVALAGAIVFTVSVGGGSAGPTPPSAIFVAGVVYPAAFGSAGAVVGNSL